MAIVNGQNLARSFGAVDIFDGVTVSIPHGARIALVGPNGSGKTTLLNLLSKQDAPTSGTVTHSKGLQVGFLPQEATHSLCADCTLWEEMLGAFEDLLILEARLNQMADELAEYPEDEELLEAYGAAQLRFDLAGGFEYFKLQAV